MTISPFERLIKLVGPEIFEKLQAAHVLVVGLGGVGGFAAEALARSGIGHLKLVDFDQVGLSNINRQLPALHSTLGRPKAEVMAERIKDINPEIDVTPLSIRCDDQTIDQLLSPPIDGVIDAIDLITYKCLLLAICRERKIPIVTSLGAAGRLDPTRVQLADLNRTEGDHLAAHVRKILRQKHGFPLGKTRFGIPAVYSDEPAIKPFGTADPESYLSADSGDRARTGGSAAFVTGTFGLTAAAALFQILLGIDPIPVRDH